MRLVLDDRTADRAAELTALGVGLVEVALLGEVVLRGPVGILPEGEGAAVKVVRSALGHRVDDGAGRAPELGVELVGDDLELLDGLDGGPRLRAGALTDDIVVVVAAVQHVVVAARIRSVHRNRIRAERLGADARDDAREQADEADEVAIDRRQVDELAAADVAADFLGRDIDERRLGRHAHDFLDAADGELQIERRRLADFEADVAQPQLLESLQLGGDLVHTWRQAADEICSVRAADGLAEHPCRLVLRDHRCPRHGGALRVNDLALDLGRSLLRERVRGQ